MQSEINQMSPDESEPRHDQNRPTQPNPLDKHHDLWNLLRILVYDLPEKLQEDLEP